jgi:hypothetical protein
MPRQRSAPKRTVLSTAKRAVYSFTGNALGNALPAAGELSRARDVLQRAITLGEATRNAAATQSASEILADLTLASGTTEDC